MRNLVWAVVTAIAFVTGAIGGVAGFWWLQKNLQGSVLASGVLEYQGEPTAGASVPPPEGYYIQAAGVERVYVTAETVNQYLDKDISARGQLSTICGADGSPCYPLIQAESINVVPR